MLCSIEQRNDAGREIVKAGDDLETVLFNLLGEYGDSPPIVKGFWRGGNPPMASGDGVPG
jgi:hypothetical protein